MLFKWIIIGIVIAVIVSGLFWFIIARLRRKYSGNGGFVHRRVLLPAGQEAISNPSDSFSPFASPYSPKPPPLGFGHPDSTLSHHSNTNSYLNTYPPRTPKAPYPLHSENRAPYPTETSCYPPAHTAPYPIDSSMPQPSTSRNTYYSDGNICESVAPYFPAHQAPYPPSNGSVIHRPSVRRTLGFSDNNTEQLLPSNNRILVPAASSAPYPSERRVPSAPARRAPYPPAINASSLSEPPPPSYQDAVNKF